MKKLLLFAVLILIEWPLLAVGYASESSAPISGPLAPIADAVAGSLAVQPPRTDSGFGPDSEILLPVVINASGLNGTFFKTDGSSRTFGMSIRRAPQAQLPPNRIATVIGAPGAIRTRDL